MEKCVVKFDVEFLPSEYDHNYKMVHISSEDIKKEVEDCLHTTDESMDKELFFQAIEVYANIIANWVGIVEEQD